MLPTISFSLLSLSEQQVYSQVLTADTVRFTATSDNCIASTVRLISPPSTNYAGKEVQKAEDRERHHRLLTNKTAKSISPVRVSLSMSPERRGNGRGSRIEERSGRNGNCGGKESMQFGVELLGIAQELGLIPPSSRRPQLLPSAELTHIIEEIYLLLRKSEESGLKEMVVEYFRGRFRGKKGREKAENFLHTLTVGKAQTWEVKGFLKVVSGEWPDDVLYLYNTALLRLEALTQSKLSMSTFHTEYLGDSHSLSLSSLYLSAKDSLALLASICSHCARLRRSSPTATDTPANALLYELLASHLAHV